MRAHFVPVAYLKGFSDQSAEPRHSKAYAVAKDRMFHTALDNLCVCSDYYSAFPEEDAALFEELEAVLGALLDKARANDRSELRGIALHLWRLKLRNRAILDFSHHKQPLMAAGENVDLDEHETHFVSATRGLTLITSDDPLLLFGDGGSEAHCFILPLSPELLLVSAPTPRFSVTNSEASPDDVLLLNKLQCKQARRYVIMGGRAIRPKGIPESHPGGASTGKVRGNPGRSSVAPRICDFQLLVFQLERSWNGSLLPKSKVTVRASDHAAQPAQSDSMHHDTAQRSSRPTKSAESLRPAGRGVFDRCTGGKP